MIIVGLENLGLNSFSKINAISDIQNTNSNAVVEFKYNEDILKYCQQNNVKSAVEVTNIQEVVFANILDASFIIVSKELCLEAQKLADHYMYDAKILVEIASQDEISWAASNLIDGVILK
jgi:hypothetical protein